MNQSESGTKMVETVVGALPPGRYQLRERADGSILIVRLDPPSQTKPSFWKGLKPFV